MKMETNDLWIDYKNEKRYQDKEKYEIAIIDPKNNNRLLGFWSGENWLSKGFAFFCADERLGEASREWVDKQLESRALKSFLKKEGYKSVRVKIEINIIFNEM